MSNQDDFGMERAQRLAAEYNANQSRHINDRINYALDHGRPVPQTHDNPFLGDARIAQYDQGQKACKDGVDFFQNPHANPKGNREFFAAWFAGWCHQKQLNSKK